MPNRIFYNQLLTFYKTKFLLMNSMLLSSVVTAVVGFLGNKFLPAGSSTWLLPLVSAVAGIIFKQNPKNGAASGAMGGGLLGAVLGGMGDAAGPGLGGILSSVLGESSSGLLGSLLGGGLLGGAGGGIGGFLQGMLNKGGSNS